MWGSEAVSGIPARRAHARSAFTLRYDGIQCKAPSRQSARDDRRASYPTPPEVASRWDWEHRATGGLRGQAAPGGQLRAPCKSRDQTSLAKTRASQPPSPPSGSVSLSVTRSSHLPWKARRPAWPAAGRRGSPVPEPLFRALSPTLSTWCPRLRPNCPRAARLWPNPRHHPRDGRSEREGRWRGRGADSCVTTGACLAGPESLFKQDR